jgi:hypothetical protein
VTTCSAAQVARIVNQQKKCLKINIRLKKKMQIQSSQIPYQQNCKNPRMQNIRREIIDPKELNGKFRGKNSYHDATSSRAKRTPPTGARNAAATPAADPQVIKSLLSPSFLKYLSQLQVRWYLRDPPCPSKLAMHAPVCTIGPSFPSTNPAETPSIEPKICQIVEYLRD